MRVNLTSDSHFDRPVRLIVFYTVGSVSYKYLELFSYHTSFISWIHVWWKVWVCQYKNSEHYSDIFFLNLACFDPWCSSLLTRNLYIWNGIKILVNEIEAQIWYDITLVDQKVFLSFKTCQFLYFVKTFSTGLLLFWKVIWLTGRSFF